MSAYDLAVLAGGDGLRIGGDKPAVRLAGRPLLVWVLAALAPGARRVGIVARTPEAAAALCRLAAPFLDPPPEPWTDAAEGEGPVAALLGAARAADAPRLLVAPADAPFLPTDLAARLAPGGIAVDDGGRLHPTVLLADRARLAALGPDHGLRRTVAPLALPEVVLPAALLANINTPADLAAAERRLRDPLTGPRPSG